MKMRSSILTVVLYCSAFNVLERRIYVQLSYRYRIIVRYASDDSAPILVPVFAIVDLTNLSQSTTWAIEEEGNPFPELDDVPLFAVLRSKSAALPDSPEMDEGGHDLVRAMVGYRIAVATLDRKGRPDGVWACTEIGAALDLLADTERLDNQVATPTANMVIAALERYGNAQVLPDAIEYQPTRATSLDISTLSSFSVAEEDLDAIAWEESAASILNVLEDMQDGCILSLKVTLPIGCRNLEVAAACAESSALPTTARPGHILCQRLGALLVCCADGTGIWITAIRPRSPSFSSLPATAIGSGRSLIPENPIGFSVVEETYQPIWLEWQTWQCRTAEEVVGPRGERLPVLDYADLYLGQSFTRVSYLFFDVPGGRLSACHSRTLREALRFAIDGLPDEEACSVLTLMGSSEAAFCLGPAADTKSLMEYNALVEDIFGLHRRGLTTVAILQGDAVDGGACLAAACDIVIAAPDVVVSPSLTRPSHLHSYTYAQRCPSLRPDAPPLGAVDAYQAGLVDAFLPDQAIQSSELIKGIVGALPDRIVGDSSVLRSAPWTWAGATGVKTAGVPLLQAFRENKKLNLKRIGFNSKTYLGHELAALHDSIHDDAHIAHQFECPFVPIVPPLPTNDDTHTPPESPERYRKRERTVSSTPPATPKLEWSDEEEEERFQAYLSVNGSESITLDMLDTITPRPSIVAAA